MTRLNLNKLVTENLSEDLEDVCAEQAKQVERLAEIIKRRIELEAHIALNKVFNSPSSDRMRDSLSESNGQANVGNALTDPISQSGNGSREV